MLLHGSIFRKSTRTLLNSAKSPLHPLHSLRHRNSISLSGIMLLLSLVAAATLGLSAALPGKSTLFTNHYGSPSQRDAHLRDATALNLVAAGVATATRLRVEYLANPLSIDVASPKFSWALSHPNRGELQTAYQIVVKTASAATVWDSGKVASNKTLNVVFGGSAMLASDSDYVWTVTFWDSLDTPSAPASASFSTALYNEAAWQGASWISSANSGANNTYRTQFTVGASAVIRARLYISAMGYGKTWINGRLTDDHELGQFTTFEQRVLYDVVDVTPLVDSGCNALGVMIGAGWWSEPSVNSGVRQFRLLLSVSTADGNTQYYPSAVGSGSPVDSSARSIAAVGGVSLLSFVATSGPVTSDNIYAGETYDGRIEAALGRWLYCGYTPTVPWAPAVQPAKTPTTLGSVISAHNVWIRTDREYTGIITQPGQNVYVYNFVQNMAAQVTLRVDDCPAGTVIKMSHSEILYPNGSVHNHYMPGAAMTGVYICAGTGGTETYSTMFVYYGSQYVQLEGYPGVPGENVLTSRFIHSDTPQSGEFSASSELLNAIQHATRYASWSNLMDIPSDCPQRERRGWLGDAQLSFATVIHNIDGGAFYTKWIKDLVDTQVYDNRTMNAKGALPDCVPFYGHGGTESDPGWGIAFWVIADQFAQFYDDDSFETAYYPHLKWYMDHWVDLATANAGIFPVASYGDWAEFYPGPYSHRTVDYSDFFYVLAIQKTLMWAQRLNIPADVARYSSLLDAAKALYLKTYYTPATACFADCMYVSQIFGLSLEVIPSGSAEEAAVWANALSWFNGDGKNAKYPNHFGGGIIALALVYPLLDKFNEKGLGLNLQLQSTVPAFGQWIHDFGATTLWEAWDLTNYSGSASYNHIMFGGSGSWYYSTLAGLSRAPNSRSWSDLVIAPPGPETGIHSNLSWASASVDTPMGLASISWSIPTPIVGGACATAPENGVMMISCEGGTFSSVAFASFGTPAGSCSTGFTVNPSCNAATSMAVVTAACAGKSSCNITASNGVFGGDPCVNTLKELAVVMNGNCLKPLYELQTTIPVNGRASVVVPSMKAPSAVTITEGGKPVWSNNAFVPGVSGVTAGMAVGTTAVAFTVGGGAYSFVVA